MSLLITFTYLLFLNVFFTLGSVCFLQVAFSLLCYLFLLCLVVFCFFFNSFNYMQEWSAHSYLQLCRCGEGL